ncbi:MAG: hypothetical protein LBP35_06310 [Candidatus Ancillula trichonymphae]|jgi:hypothetical protein|nr:hypothetical protein [Candidatus Ancillula trichonymphae]
MHIATRLRNTTGIALVCVLGLLTFTFPVTLHYVNRAWAADETSVELSLGEEPFCTLSAINTECPIPQPTKMNKYNNSRTLQPDDASTSGGSVKYVKSARENDASSISIVFSEVETPNLVANFTGDATVKVQKTARIGAILSKTGSNLDFSVDGGDFTVDSSSVKNITSISGVNNLTLTTGSLAIKSSNNGVAAANLLIKDGAKLSVEAHSDAVTLTSYSKEPTLNMQGHAELTAVSETGSGVSAEAVKVVDSASFSATGESHGIAVMGKLETTNNSKVSGTATGSSGIGILAHGILVENGATLEGKATNPDDLAITYGIATSWKSDIRAKGMVGDTTAIHGQGTVGITTLYPTVNDSGNINITSASVEASGRADAVQVANLALSQNSRFSATSSSANAVGIVGALSVSDSSVSATGGEYGVNATGTVSFLGSSNVTSSGAVSGISSGESMTVADLTEVAASKTADSPQVFGETTVKGSGVHAGADLYLNIFDGGKVNASSSSDQGFAISSGGPTFGYIPVSTVEKSTQQSTTQNGHKDDDDEVTSDELNDKTKSSDTNDDMQKLEVPYFNENGGIQTRDEVRNNTGSIKLGSNARIGDSEIINLTDKNGPSSTVALNGVALNAVQIHSVSKSALEKFLDKWDRQVKIADVVVLLLVLFVLLLVVVKLVRGNRALIVVDMQKNLKGVHPEISVKLNNYLKQHAKKFKRIFVTRGLLTNNKFSLLPEVINNLDDLGLKEVFTNAEDSSEPSIFNGVVMNKKKKKTVPVELVNNMRRARIKRVFVCGTLAQGGMVVGVQELVRSKKFSSVVFLPELSVQVAPNQLEQAKEVLKKEGARIA